MQGKFFLGLYKSTICKTLRAKWLSFVNFFKAAEAQLDFTPAVVFAATTKWQRLCHAMP